MNQANQSSKTRKFPKTLAEQAKIFGYQKITPERDWEITLTIPAMELFRSAAICARAEGYIHHALAIEARLPYMRSNFKYRPGRSRHGCQTCHVGP